MRKLLINQITLTSGMPWKAGTPGFIQYAYGELFTELLQEIYPNLIIEDFITAVRGCSQSGSSGTTYDLAAGAIFVGGNSGVPSGTVEPYGELFLLPSSQTTTTSGDSAILTLGITYYSPSSGIADPVLFTDGTTKNVHAIRTLILTHGDSTTPGFVCYLDDLIYAAPTYLPPYTELAVLVTDSAFTQVYNNTGATITWGKTNTGIYTLTASSPIFTAKTIITFGQNNGLIELVVTNTNTITINVSTINTTPVPANISVPLPLRIIIYN